MHLLLSYAIWINLLNNNTRIFTICVWLTLPIFMVRVSELSWIILYTSKQRKSSDTEVDFKGGCSKWEPPGTEPAVYKHIYRPAFTFSTSWRRVVNIRKINTERERERERERDVKNFDSNSNSQTPDVAHGFTAITACRYLRSRRSLHVLARPNRIHTTVISYTNFVSHAWEIFSTRWSRKM
jgi:hypothetical protein